MANAKVEPQEIADYTTDPKSIGKGRPVPKSIADIESEARKEVKAKEGEVLYEDEWLKSEAESKTLSKPDEDKAQTREDTETETPDKSDKVEDEVKEPADGQPEPSDEEKPEEKVEEEKEKPPDADADKDSGELKSKLTKVEQENSLLRDMLVKYRDTAAAVNELSKFKEDVSPYLPLISTIKDIKELKSNIQIPEDQMSGENQDGSKFATEEDKMKAIASSEQGFALLVNKAVERQMQEHDKAKSEQQRQNRTIVAELATLYNDGKPFSQELFSEISKSMDAEDVNKLNDPKITYNEKKKIWKGALTDVLLSRKTTAGELTKVEIEAKEKAEKLAADKAQLNRSRSNLRPKTTLTPEQKKAAEMWIGMGKVLSGGRIDLDSKKK
jgi:hypothetical protein